MFRAVRCGLVLCGVLGVRCVSFLRVRRGAAGRRGAGMRCVVQAVAAPGGFTAWDTAVQRVPKRTDIKTIMLLGAGPIVIGQVRGRISGGFQIRTPRRR